MPRRQSATEVTAQQAVQQPTSFGPFTQSLMSQAQLRPNTFYEARPNTFYEALQRVTDRNVEVEPEPVMRRGGVMRRSDIRRTDQPDPWPVPRPIVMTDEATEECCVNEAPQPPRTMEEVVACIAENVASSADITMLSDTVIDLEKIKDDLEAKLKIINEQIDKTKEKLTQEMINQETPNINRRGKILYLNTRTFASPVEGQRETLYAALKEIGEGDMVKETVNANTLSSWAKSLLEEDNMPDNIKELLNIYEKTTVNLRNSSR